MELDRVDPTLREGVLQVGGGDLGGRTGRLLERLKIGGELDSRAGRLLGRIRLRLVPRPKQAAVRIGRDRLGGVRVRTYAPSVRRTDAVLVWIHGGGMLTGAPHGDDELCSEISAELGMRVASVDYRLAPEHPFPAPLDDCHAVFASLVQRGCARIAIGGQSAGGGLAAALAQRLLDTGGTQPIAQLLLCPMLDDRTAADRALDDIEHFVWSNRSNRLGWRALLGTEPGAADAPRHAVPARRSDLAGLPPAWIGVGDIDLFHDEDVAYARRLESAGVDVELRVVPGAPHGFEGFAAATPLAEAYRARARAWLAERIGG